MIYKTYRAQTYREAVLDAKMELGNDIYIIGRKNVKQGGIFGLFAKHFTEITVARNEDRNNITNNKAFNMVKSEKKLDKSGIEPEILKELNEIKVRLKEIMIPKKREGDNIYLKRLLDILIENDFSLDYIDRLRNKFEDELTLNEAHDPKVIEEKLKSYILDSLETSGPIELGKDKPTIVVLVGPTGVGKTTTIAKLAASFGVLQKHRVELFTIDSYRIAAIEQLGKYAELMQLPFTVITSREEFRSAVSNSKSEVIFVDTAGRSQKNNMGLAELRTILDGVKTDLDIHLVLSATTKCNDALDIITRFNQLMYQKIIISKLDETNTIGSLLSVLNKDKRLSYFTTGQSVPDDIELAEKQKLLDMLVINSFCIEPSGG